MSFHEAWSVPGIFGGGVKTNDAYAEGNIFLTLPVYSSIGRDGWLQGDVLFLEPYSSWGEEGEVAVSLGLGWRHLFSGQSIQAVTGHDGHQAAFFEEGVFIGANVFADLLDTQFDNRFWQLGFGLEAGTRYLEWRANYYLPLSDRQETGEIRTRESATQRTTVQTYDEPFATGYTIQQDVRLTTYDTTTTIERLFRKYEDGMEGWDMEVALLLPWIDRWMDVKVIGGYYAFDNQPFGPQTGGTGNVEGWKAGVEMRPVPAVVLTATWYEDERLTGGDWVAGLRLEVPFEVGDLGDGKGFWDRIGDAFHPRRRHLAERMAEPVRRQNDAIKTATKVEEDKSAAEVSVVTRVVSQSRTRIVLAETVVFVDSAIGSPANPGTYESPLDSIQNGENFGNVTFGDNAIVFVQGRPAPYVESVVISQGTHLLGSGVGFPALGGRTFHGRTLSMPFVYGGFLARDLRGTVKVEGFDISGGLTTGGLTALGFQVDGNGILLENVDHAIISKNNIHVLPIVGYGILGFVTGAHNSVIEVNENTIDHNYNGMLLYALDFATLSASITANSISHNGDFLNFGRGLEIGAVDFAQADFTVTGNVMTGNFDMGIFAATSDFGQATFLIRDNVITGNGTYGLIVQSGESSYGIYIVQDNVLSGNGQHGLEVEVIGDGFTEVRMSGNTIQYNGSHQIHAEKFFGSGAIYFVPSAGDRSNTVTETPFDPDSLYLPVGVSGFYLLINDMVWPADVELP